MNRTQVIFAVVVCAVVLACAPAARALPEGFNNVAMLTGADWVLKNNSSPLGTTGWFQGNPTEFSAHQGPANSYIAANFNNAGNGAGSDTISNWLILPQMTLQDGDTFSFYTRTATPGVPVFPDRLQVRMSTSGASTDVGTTATSTGDFGLLMLDINPAYLPSGPGSYPTVFTLFNVTISGVGGSTSGRLAFRYFVENGGPGGERSNYIGIDTVSYTIVPEPGVALLIVAGIGVIGQRSRRQAALRRSGRRAR